MSLVSQPPLAPLYQTFALSPGSAVTGISGLSLKQVGIWSGDLEPEMQFFFKQKRIGGNYGEWEITLCTLLNMKKTKIKT